ncbi:MAG TPA: geranylgeranyl reductase family protein [Chloroflexi bacterium]|nr:geranylgeranyl reductase family protein [Chloroflexota bacterium]
MVYVRPSLCSYCGACVSVCPQNALTLAETRLVVSEACTDCGLCVRACPVGALEARGEGQEARGKGQPATRNSQFATRHLPLATRYDIIVIGAGPAGSMAALKAAQHGASVLLLEKRQEIGSPVRCAEGISHEALTRFWEPDPSFIAATIERAEFYTVAGGRTELRMAGEGARGYVLERRIFDRFLAEQAALAGAHVAVKTAAVGLVIEGEKIRGVQISTGLAQPPRGCKGQSPLPGGVPPEISTIEASVIIAADGVESRVARWAGLGTHLKLRDTLSCAQYLLAGIEIDPAAVCYYTGEEIAPGGYAWVFPKGEGRANVGLGIQPDVAREPAINYLIRFIESQPHLAQGSPVTLVTGAVPLRPVENIVGDGILVVGDAAGQADPLTGGGIPFAMAAGALAGEVAAKFAGARRRRALTGLEEYKARWEADWGRRLRRNYRLKERFSPGDRISHAFLRVFAVATAAVK